MATARLTWRKIAYGWLSGDGRWMIRGPIHGMRMWWLYLDEHRYSETGRFEDSPWFPTAAAAKRYVERKVK